MNWQTELRDAIGGFTQDVEALVEEISRDAMGAIDRFVDQFVELSDDFVGDATNTIGHEFETPIANFLDRDLEELLNSLLRPFIDFSIEDINSPNSFMPSHVLCENCENYHGQSYGGTQLNPIQDETRSFSSVGSRWFFVHKRSTTAKVV